VNETGNPAFILRDQKESVVKLGAGATGRNEGWEKVVFFKEPPIARC
jgi:hypothetical protein